MSRNPLFDSRTKAYQDALKQTRLAVRQQVEQHYRALPDIREENAAKFVTNAVRIVQAGQQRAIALTTAHFSQRAGITTPVALDAQKIIANIRQGMPAETVYMRPIITARAGIEANGYARAFEIGLSRLLDTADMDVAMTARDASSNFVEATPDQVLGYMRCADPNCCDYCTMIDGAFVLSAEAAPLHNNCGCSLEPLLKSDPLIAHIQQEGVANYRERTDSWVRIIDSNPDNNVEIRSHGEMGPVITPKGSDFTTLADLPKSYRNELATAEAEAE